MTDDVLDRLRAADPLADQPLPDPTAAAAVAMRDQILAMDRDVDVVDLDRRRQRRRRAMAIGVALAAAAATAAAILVATRNPTEVTFVGCYDRASTSASTAVVAATGPNPVEPCRQLWETGDMDPDVDSPDEVPPLVACVLDSGAVGVFPAPSCNEVDTADNDAGRPEPAVQRPTHRDADATASPDPTTTGEPGDLPMPDYQTSDETVRQALERIRLEMIDRCLTLQAATDLAEDVLSDHGIEGWTIEPIWEGHTDQTCAGFFPDAPEQAIWWTPEAAPEGQTPGPR